MSTYSKIYIQVIFAVRNRESLINESWEEHLYRYISGIINNKKQKLIAINGIPNHIHFFIGMKTDCCLSDLVREIKKSSNEFIKQNNFTKQKFNWQEGFGAFSYSESDIPNVISYIMNQKEHHKIKNFREEYIDLLDQHKIDYQEKYLFDWLE